MTKYYRIFNARSKRYVLREDSGFLVCKSPQEAKSYITKRLGDSPVFKIVEYRKKVR